ncbi:MAG TPA: multiprotein bridging factor aMBF1 [archaeon]|nr:multiprotein bridging factor aMBF1 [archaeon]
MTLRRRVTLNCEVCGKQIQGKPYRAIIEEAEMLVCSECARLGSTSWEMRSKSAPTRSKTASKPMKPASMEEELELVEDYAQKIRQAREKLNLNYNDLGKRIGEKVSVLHQIETLKMVPNKIMSRKLEHALKIKLLVNPTETTMIHGTKQSPPQLTFGDVVKVKKREKS